jgi:hypothetical protein
MNMMWTREWVDARYVRDENGTVTNCLRYAEPKLNRFFEAIEGCDVAISHFFPNLEELISERFRSMPSTAYFTFELPTLLMQMPKVWHIGHSHDVLSVKTMDCHFIRNPYGYPSEQSNKLILTYDNQAQ